MTQGIYDAAVVGGGLVGSALAYGLRASLDRVVVLDEGDAAYRASRGNFGLVWVQSKGMGMPRYGVWTMRSVREWPGLAAELLACTGVDVRLEQNGGLHVLLSDEEVEARIAFMTKLLAQPGMSAYEWKLLDCRELADMVPGIGPDVRGATWTPVDGIANPLKLLRAFHIAFDKLGVDYRPRQAVVDLRKKDGVFEIDTTAGRVRAKQVVLAAGLGNAVLGKPLGLDVPVRPQRGQIIALERTRRMLEVPFVTLRQMDEGTWLIGDSQEEAGFADEHVSLSIVGTLAERRTTILDVQEKTGRTGQLLFVTLRHEYTQAGTLAISEEQDIVYRQPTPPKLTGSTPAPSGEWRETVTPAPTLLFRYSAVTFNGHRIHYDHPYVTQTEGYPGLVVHGPLIATLMLAAFRRAQPGAVLQHLSYRGLRPLIAPTPFTVAGRVADTTAHPGVADLWAEQDGTLAHQAQLQFSL